MGRRHNKGATESGEAQESGLHESGSDYMRLSGLCLALAATLCGCDSPRTPLKADEVQRAARDLGSLSAEGALLADQLQQGNLGANYVWVHQHALQEEVRKVGDSLQKPVPPELREAVIRIVGLEARLASSVGQLGFAAQQPVQLQSLAQGFDAVQAQANALKGGKEWATSSSSPWAS